MEKLVKAIKRLYLAISGSIAFWPTLFSLAFFLLSIYVWHFEGTAWSKNLEGRLPLFKNPEEDTENARLLLNIIASGTITLAIFSFSMVMIVLSQASSNLSPRIIPGLYRYLTPIRTYGKQDVMVVLKIMESLKILIILNKKTALSFSDLFNQVTAITEDAKEAIVNPVDRIKVNNMLQQLRAVLPPEYHFSQL